MAVITGTSGNDTLSGTSGPDELRGGLGNDRYLIDESADQIVEAEGEGDDRVIASVSYALGAGVSIETLQTDDHSGTVAIDLTGNEFANAIHGNAGDNRLGGGDGNDVLVGRDGNDRLDGGAGIDTLAGGVGDDTYFVDAAGDVVSEFSGRGDDIVLASVSYVLRAGVSVETLQTADASGTAAIDLTGNEFANAIQGNAGNNRLGGGDGNDVLVGRDGNDRLDGGAGIDTLAGGVGNDTYFVDAAGDVVSEFSGRGDDRVIASVSYALGAGVSVETLRTDDHSGTATIDLTGNELANAIRGNAGANVVDGRGGYDTLTGGAGADTFAFTTALGTGNVDTITDFELGIDKILLGGAPGEPFAALATGALDSRHFVVAAQAQDADDLLIYNPLTGALLYDADGSGAGSAIRFAILQTGLTLTAAHFEVSGSPNGAPSISSGATASVAENSPTSTVVYQAAATDPNGDRIFWSLAGGPDVELLSIDQTGAVRLLESADHETQDVYNFSVVATDSGTGSTIRDVILTITEVPEATPVIAETTGSNNTGADAQWVDRNVLTPSTNPDLPDDGLPSATITGSISNSADVDYYAIHLEAGEAIYLDIDNSSGNLDAYLDLYRINGGEVPLLSSDDLGAPDPGSDPHPEYGHNTDSFIRLRVNSSGTYLFAVSSFQDPERPTSGSYELHVSIGPPATAAEILEEDVQALISGAEWDHTNLTYAFPTLASQYPSGIEETDEPGEFAPLTAVQQSVVTRHLGAIGAISGLSFSLAGNAGQADLRFALSNEADPAAYAYYPSNLGPDDLGGTAWFDMENYGGPQMGNYAWLTFLHETGHTLGLKHGHESPPISTGHDSLEFTVMTYRSYVGQTIDDGGGFTNETFGFPQSLMMLDIAALQQMYGADFGLNSGNTVYRWSPATGEMSINGVGQGAPGANRIFMTLWDGGGTDTYDLSNYSTAVDIDLRPGEWTSTNSIQLAGLGNGRSARGNIANALQFEGDPRSLIENATAGSGQDTLYGNGADNILDGGAGNDEIYGLGGDDTLYAGPGGGKLYGADGNDSLHGGELAYGGTGNDTLTGTGDFDYLDGESGDDWIEGLGGNDNLFGGAGNDYIDGGDGNDVLDGGDGDDVLIDLSGSGNDLYGGAGNDTLTGGDGNDSLIGHFGIDVMTGGLGDDTYYVDEVGDQVNEIEGQGIDEVLATISFVAPLAIENVQLRDWTYFEYGGPPPSTGPIDATGNALENVLGGNSEANILMGLGGADRLSGGSGNDVLDGGAGADRMTGGHDDDTFYVDDLGDEVYDTDFWSQQFRTLTVGGNDTVYSSVSIVLLSVPTTQYIFTPNGQVAVTLELNTIESLVLTGTANLDATGNGSDGSIHGNSGHNVLDGKGGHDTLSGASGADSFAFTTALGDDNVDTIADFVAADDTIVLDDAVFTGLALGALAAGAFRIGTAAADANDRIIYDSTTGQLLFDIDGVGGAAAVHFATLSGAPSLSANDFLVI